MPLLIKLTQILDVHNLNQDTLRTYAIVFTKTLNPYPRFALR
jgi:hypothetical protein